MRRLASLAMLGVLFLGACGSDDPQATNAPSASDEPSETTETTRPSKEPSTLVDVQVKDGKVVGGLKRVDVPLDSLVRVSVSSDVGDEVHVHGYDKKYDIEAGGVIIRTFRANVPGVFIIELEELGLHIAELEVH